MALNQLLAQLPPSLLASLEPHLTVVPLAPRQVLCQQGVPIQYVFFPNGGIVSIVTVFSDGAMAETATVGKEGMIGIEAFFSENSISPSQAVVQVPIAGQAAMRMRVADFRRLLAESPILHDAVARYVYARFARVGLLAACNARHDVHKRCARWLLLADDHMNGSEFHLTQEFLAVMLGVRRQSVSVVAGRFRTAGMIRYAQGHITVLDRKRLERASCECYKSIARTCRLVTDPAIKAIPW